VVLVADRVPQAEILVADDAAGQHGWGTGRTARVIAGMPPKQQTLLAERYTHDLDLSSIVQLHGGSVSSVSQRLKTAHRHVLAMMPSVSLHTAAD
jgi:DNA-directed RNA polymerase specialized sigma24 family protein